VGSRSAAGSIRQRPDGRWEARYTVEGKRKSIYGETQKEVRQKLTAIQADIDNGIYQAPTKLTLSAWLDTWQKDYLGDVKPRTVDSYKNTVRLHILPAIGKVKIQSLSTVQIQTFYNGLQRAGLSAKTIKNIHGVLHRALNDALSIGLIRFNPCTACKLPKVMKPEISPFDEKQIAAFLNAVRGHKYENLFILTLFCGLRQGEVLGLSWDCVNSGVITINKQLQRARDGSHSYLLAPTKNDKARYIKPAQTVLDALHREKVKQKLAKLQAGPAWNNDKNLVFTDEFGHSLSAQTVYLHFKKVAADIGAPQARFHDLRHSYAVLALKAGDDIKTVQSNLGHHTAAFTLDTYAYVTEQMKQESADRMERQIQKLLQG
jgi:integrase